MHSPRSLYGAVLAFTILALLIPVGCGDSPNKNFKVSVAAVSLTGSTVALGNSQAFVVTVTNSSGQSISNYSVQWSSSNAAVFSVNQTGGGTSVSQGTAVITATVSVGSTVKTATFTVTVGPAVLKTLTISPGNSTMHMGDSPVTFSATGTMTDNTAWTPAPLTWSSSNTAAATIDATTAVATAVAAGSTTIKADSGSVSATTTLTIQAVNNPAPTLGSITPTHVTAGTSAFSLSVTGTGFVSSSVVHWNSAALSTTYSSSTSLSASVPAADIVTSGTASITVVNPSPGGGTSSAATFTIDPAGTLPQITSLSPSSASPGGPAFTLTVNGSGFVSGASVQWNGSGRTTTYVNSSQLTAAITAADIASAGSSNVTVINPDNSTSNQVAFQVATQSVGIIDWISVTANGADPDGDSQYADITPDGRYVAFNSASTNIIAGGTAPNVWHVYLRDTCHGASGACTPSTILIDQTNTGTPAAGYFENLLDKVVSDDGRFVLFSSDSALLQRPVTANPWDHFAYLRDTCNGAAAGCTPSTAMVSVASDGTYWNDGGNSMNISATGRYITFTSNRNLSSAYPQVYMRDTCLNATSCTPSTILVTANTSGNPTAVGDDHTNSMSADGRYVSFWSESGDLVSGISYALLYIRDTCVGASGSCTPTTTNLLPDSSSHSWQTGTDNVISETGRWVAYYDYDSKPTIQVTIYDSCIGASGSCTPQKLTSFPISETWSLSPDGRYVMYDDSSYHLYAEDTCIGATGCTPTTVLVSKDQNGTTLTNWSFVNGHGLTRNGKYFAMTMQKKFGSKIYNLVYLGVTGF